MDSLYKHSQLPDWSQHIRILSLHPSKVLSAELEASLSVHVLEGHSTKYEALSYTWGSDTAPENLLLDGRRLQIGTNLRDALRRLRLPCRPRRLWIDAVCIDQTDDVEKTAQIRMMGQIYSHGWRTLIWLGEDSEENDGRISCRFFAMAARRVWCVEQLEEIQRTMISLRCKLKSCVAKIRKPRYPASSLSMLWEKERKQDGKSLVLAKLESLLDHGGRQHLERALRLFLDRPWFGRRWIIQEACLARKALMICGEHKLDWTTIYTVLEDWRHKDTRHQRAYRLFHLVDDFRLSPAEYKGQTRSFQAVAEIFLWQLSLLDEFQCKDPRDQIGALLGMWETLSGQISVDYTCSTENNYMTFAKAMTMNGLCVSVLQSAAQRPRLPNDDPEALPSWVPDWRLPAITQRAQVAPTVDNPYGPHMLDTSIPTLRPPMCSFRKLENGQEALVVRGTILDHIERVLPESGWLNFDSSDCYAKNATYGKASNIDRKALGEGPYDVAWPRNSYNLHLVRPKDVICSITADESFLQNKKQERVMFGLFVLRKLQEQSLQVCNLTEPVYTLVATFEQYEPKDPSWTRQALDAAKFEDIIIL
jgi:hypothetical protein